MKIKYVGVLLAVIGASTLGLRSARAGCIESCDAVTKITASFMDAPSCVTLTAEPDNGCTCSGSAILKNTCMFNIVAQDVMWADSTILPGQSAYLYFEGNEVGLGDHHEEVKLTGDGQTFTLVVDYTVAHVERDFGGCSASGSGAGEAASGLAMAAGALLLARRRRSRAA